MRFKVLRTNSMKPTKDSKVKLQIERTFEKLILVSKQVIFVSKKKIFLFPKTDFVSKKKDFCFQKLIFVSKKLIFVYEKSKFFEKANFIESRKNCNHFSIYLFFFNGDVT